MKVLQVIHGYPPTYNAGSEVYTQTLCHALAARHEVHVFTREEDPFAPEYRVRRTADPLDPRVALHVVNLARARDRYRHEAIDARFAALLDEVAPDVVHVGHLNHLSTSLVAAAAARSIPVLYTLHDYWLMCPRGQFIQLHPKDPADVWAACDGQEDHKCAIHCYSDFFSGAAEKRDEDVEHWASWVGDRMATRRRPRVRSRESASRSCRTRGPSPGTCSGREMSARLAGPRRPWRCCSSAQDDAVFGLLGA